MNRDAGVAVVGGGVVGLACAARLATAGHDVVLIERHAQPGTETSSRNSGVVHAGFYYPTGSLKALTCVEGQRLLYERAERGGVAYRRTGKLVVATESAEVDTLELLRQRGRDNGVEGLELLAATELRRLEPAVAAVAALWSPNSGIVDVHELMASYRAEAVRAGAMLALGTEVTALEPRRGGWCVETRARTGERYTLQVEVVVNCAGLHGEGLARLAGLETERLGLRYHWCRGDYYALSSRWRSRVRHLVYPVPAAAGLGIHLTVDLAGKIMAGPDVTYVDEISYRVAPNKQEQFARAVSRYLPGLRAGDLAYDYSGIRPKLQGPGEGFRDFVVAEASAHGAPGLINLLGIESPGLTASEALAKRVVALL